MTTRQTRPYLIFKSGVMLFTVHAYSNRQARRIAARQIVGSFMVLVAERKTAAHDPAFEAYDADLTALGL